MVAIPTFTAPIGDRVSRSVVRSSRDSRLISDVALWGVYRPARAQYALSRSIYELIADNMSMIVREAPLGFLRVTEGLFFGEVVRGVGGTRKHIWLVTEQHELHSGDWVTRLYDLSPIDFSRQREQIIIRRTSAQGAIVPRGVDGDDRVIYIGLQLVDRDSPGGLTGEIWKYNADTFTRSRRVAIGRYWPVYVAGDSASVWVSWFNINVNATGAIRQYTNNLVFIDGHRHPLQSERHKGYAMGGGSKRIYYMTYVLDANATAEWPSGTYIHTLKPTLEEPYTLTRRRTYGPFISDPYRGPRHIGGT